MASQEQLQAMQAQQHPVQGAGLDQNANDSNKAGKKLELPSGGRLERFVDGFNTLFGALFNFPLHYRYLTGKKVDSFSKLSPIGDMIFIMVLLLALPVTSTVYVFSRLAAIVFNPMAYQHNFAKATLMLGVTLLAAGVAIGLAMATSFFSAQSMMNIAGSVGGGAAVVGLVGMVVFASLLHLAKTVAKVINAQEIKLNDGTHIIVTAPKHKVQLGDSNFQLDDYQFKVQQKNVMVHYHIQKHPILPETNYTGMLLKPLLFRFEQVAKAQKNSRVTPDMLNDLRSHIKRVDAVLSNKVSGFYQSEQPVHDANEAFKKATVADGKIRINSLKFV